MTSYRTASEIIQCDESHSIGVMSRVSPVDTIKFLASKMREAINFWAVGRSTFDSEEGKARIVELIRLIVQEYSWLKPSDIRLVFDNAKKGKYGETYNRMDGPLILSWFKKYAEERIQVAEDIAIRKRAEAGKKLEEDTRTPEQRKSDILRLAETIGKMAKQQAKEPEIVDKTPQKYNFSSVEHYCEVNGIDPEQYLHNWERSIMHDIHMRCAELGIDYDTVYYARKSRLLWQINHGLV
jgi:hypothetical protein